MADEGYYRSKEEAINAAKEWIYANRYDATGRQWLFATPKNSYTNSPTSPYMVEIYVLEGSPPRGVIYAYGEKNGIVVAWESAFLDKDKSHKRFFFGNCANPLKIKEAKVI